MTHETKRGAPARPCARCGNGVLIRCVIHERAPTGSETDVEFLSPLAVTFARSRRDRPSQEVTDVDQPLGILSCLVCRACGFVDWYALHPGEIPIGREYGTELVDVGGRRE